MQLPSYPHRIRARSGAPGHNAVQIHVVDFANHRVQQRRVPHPAPFNAHRTKSIQPVKPA
jgi:hypothetical protein